MSASWRWKHRQFTHFDFEKRGIEYLLKWASRRYEKKVSGKKTKDADIMDWGVRLSSEGSGAKGEYMTGELGKK